MIVVDTNHASILRRKLRFSLRRLILTTTALCLLLGANHARVKYVEWHWATQMEPKLKETVGQPVSELRCLNELGFLRRHSTVQNLPIEDLATRWLDSHQSERRMLGCCVTTEFVCEVRNDARTRRMTTTVESYSYSVDGWWFW